MRGMHDRMLRDGRSWARNFFLMSLLSFSFGCATPPFQEVPRGTLSELGPGEGFLILSVDTDVALDWLDLESTRAVTALPKGQHLWIVRAKAGHYEWSRFHVKNTPGREGIIDLSRYKVLRRHDDWVWDDEYEFDVEAGVINYPGELIINSDVRWRSSGWGYWIRNRNHSAEAVRKLEKQHPALLSAYPLHFSGPGGDGFLDYYSQKRTERTSEVTR